MDALPFEISKYLFKFSPNDFKGLNKLYYSYCSGFIDYHYFNALRKDPNASITYEEFNNLPLHKIKSITANRLDITNRVFKKIVNLESITLYNNTFISNYYFECLTNLKQLTTENDKILTSSLFKYIKNIESLSILNASEMSFNLTNLSKLKHLSWGSHGYYSNSIDIRLHTDIHLESLKLVNISINRISMNRIQLNSVKNLSIINTNEVLTAMRYSDDFLDIFPSLTYLSIYNEYMFSEEFLSGLISLETLIIKNMYYDSDKEYLNKSNITLNYLKYLPNLKVFECSYFKPNSLDIFINSNNLERLSIGKSYVLKDMSIYDYIKPLKNLRYLSYKNKILMDE